jgi:predicted alpha/beta-hydrolase family hydrolase
VTDRAGLAQAVAQMRATVDGIVAVGGHSYGGRQASMLAAEQPGLIDALLLLSYPLHPPKKPEQLRTAHFPSWYTPALFVHGTRDPFAGIEELRAAVAQIPAITRIIAVERAGHELKGVDTALVVANFIEIAG